MKIGQRVYEPHLGAFGVVIALEPEHWTPQTVTIQTDRFPHPVSWFVEKLLSAGPVVAEA